MKKEYYINAWSINLNLFNRSTKNRNSSGIATLNEYCDWTNAYHIVTAAAEVRNLHSDISNGHVYLNVVGSISTSYR